MRTHVHTLLAAAQLALRKLERRLARLLNRRELVADALGRLLVAASFAVHERRHRLGPLLGRKAA